MIEPNGEMPVPWLPPGHTVTLPGRGEMFYRRHVHPDPDAPTLLLLHGWTADADTQFFTVYEALAKDYSFVAPDHRGHGRGMRPEVPFTLEDVADDAAALVRALDVGPVITVGYSMGGPISLLLTQRHPDLVDGLVVQATALEWRAMRRERVQWWLLPLLGSGLRNRLYPRWLRRALTRMVGPDHPVRRYIPWVAGEARRNDPLAIVQAGWALSKYDARPFAPALGKPAAMLLTTHDRLVKPRKQLELGRALGAYTEELAADHLCTITHPVEYSAITVRLLEHLSARVGAELAS